MQSGRVSRRAVSHGLRLVVSRNLAGDGRASERVRAVRHSTPLWGPPISELRQAAWLGRRKSERKSCGEGRRLTLDWRRREADIWALQRAVGVTGLLPPVFARGGSWAVARPSSGSAGAWLAPTRVHGCFCCRRAAQACISDIVAGCGLAVVRGHILKRETVGSIAPRARCDDRDNSCSVQPIRFRQPIQSHTILTAPSLTMPYYALIAASARLRPAPRSHTSHETKQQIPHPSPPPKRPAKP